ncbi:MAG: zf-HC2 domain-containing protein [Pseudomonas sp.]|uniref:anti-sigma factor family protein n=1 Tax=Pseudomonas sp. TaxID=306 RepID=UPI00339435A2
MLSCKELVARSSDFLDGQLSFRGRLAVRAHLGLCRNCRRFIRQMRLVQATLRQLPDSSGLESHGPDIDSLAARLAEQRRLHSR